jgi:cobalamin synthase
MKEILGVIIVLLAIIAFLAVFRFVKKKGTYKGDFLGLIIDSVEFIVLIIALVLAGIILLTGK